MLPVGEHTEEFPELDQAPVAAIEDDVRRAVGWCRDRATTGSPTPTSWSAPTGRSPTAATGSACGWSACRWSTAGRDRQLPSEGATRGAIQVPPNGFPVILGPDHPVTGGYPVIGVVIDEDIDKVAQIRPGQTVRLHWSRPRRPVHNGSCKRPP